MRHILKFANLYKPIDDSPSGLLEILIMSLSPFKRKISLLVQDTETMSPYPSKPPIKAYKRVNIQRNYWYQINTLFGQDSVLNESICWNSINIGTYRIKILSYKKRKQNKRSRTALFNHDVAHFILILIPQVYPFSLSKRAATSYLNNIKFGGKEEPQDKFKDASLYSLSYVLLKKQNSLHRSIYQ